MKGSYKMARKERIEELKPMLERLTDPVFASVHTLITVLSEFSEKPMSFEEAEAVKAEKPVKAAKKPATKREVKAPIEDFDDDVTAPVIETMDGEDIDDFDLTEEVPQKATPKEVQEDMDIFEEEAPVTSKSAPKKEAEPAKTKVEEPDDFDDDFDDTPAKTEVKKEEPKKEEKVVEKKSDDDFDDFDF